MSKKQKWYYKQLDGCVSGNGKPYSISLKKGNVNKLHLLDKKNIALYHKSI